LHRGLSPRNPDAAAMGPLAEPALVDESYENSTPEIAGKRMHGTYSSPVAF
jgi:hypothetical protein